MEWSRAVQLTVAAVALPIPSIVSAGSPFAYRISWIDHFATSTVPRNPT
jgi:hypothetical protein